MPKNFIPPILILLLILIASLCVYKSQGLYRTYKAGVTDSLNQAVKAEKQFLTAGDIGHLPEPVQKYLQFTGVIGKEKVENVRALAEGEFKTDRQKDWVRAYSQQYNFITDPVRLYYMKVKMSGVPVVGLHYYNNAGATMQVKLAGLATVADGRGREMDRAETVTVFNDMCLLAPASLIDKRITWETIDSKTVKAAFNNNGCSISALLYFNDQGALINFVSEDRYYSTTGKTYEKVKWSTPVRDYREFNGIKLASYVEAVWLFPDDEFCYARMNIKDVEYNCESLR